jgi:hypothetical protein
MKSIVIIYICCLFNICLKGQGSDPILCEPWAKQTADEFIQTYGSDCIFVITRNYEEYITFFGYCNQILSLSDCKIKTYNLNGDILESFESPDGSNCESGYNDPNQVLLFHNLFDSYPECSSVCLTCYPKSNPLTFTVNQDTSVTIEHLMSESSQGCNLSFDRTQSKMEIPFKCSFLKGQSSALDSFWVYDLVKGDSCLSYVRFVNQDFCKCSDGTFASTHINDQRTICNIQNIENTCFRMKVVQDKSWWKRNWLCENGGNVESPNLLTFIAGSGNYKINIDASNCTIDQNGYKGIQIGLFSDSVFQNTVFCANGVNIGNGLTEIEIPSNILTPSQKYFLIIDGFANSFCDINIDIIGSYVPFSLPILECQPKINPLQFTIKKDTTLNVNSLNLQPNCSNLSFDKNTKLLQKDIDCTFLEGQQSSLDSFWVYDLVTNDSCLSYVRFVNGGYCNNCTHPDYAPLMALYTSTTGKDWTNNTGWKEGAEGSSCDPCSGWHGIGCTNNRVSSINLDNNNLMGILPNLNLPYLTSLRCGWNRGLSGPIPDFSNTPLLTNLIFIR